MYIGKCYSPCGRLWTTVQSADREEVESEALALCDGEYGYYFVVEEETK